MKKKIITAVSAIVLSAALTQTVFADWTQDNSGWRYVNSDNTYAANEWIAQGDNWYYLDGSGYMAVNCWIGNYYVGNDGVMLKNTTTPDGYQVGGDGAWIQDSQFSESEKQFWSDVAEIHYYSMRHSSSYDRDVLDYFMGIFITTNNTFNTDQNSGATQISEDTYRSLINNIFGSNAADNLATPMWERSSGNVIIPRGDFGMYSPDAQITAVNQLSDGKVRIQGIARGMKDVSTVADSMNFEMVLIPASNGSFSAYQLQSITYN